VYKNATVHGLLIRAQGQVEAGEVQVLLLSFVRRMVLNAN